MSEQTEKIVNIILPDLLNYLEMHESGEVIERLLKKDVSNEQCKEEKVQKISCKD